MSVLSHTFEAAAAEIAPAVDRATREMPSWVDRPLVRMGLTEAVTNAVLHGALGISPELRASDYEAFLASACSIRSTRLITLDVEVDPTSVRIRLAWEGHPCLPGARRAQPSPGGTSGYGLSIIGAAFDEVSWSEEGRSMALVCRRVPAVAAS